MTGRAAVGYARAGWFVFPVVPRGKAPLTRHGLLDATTDLATVAAWWRRWPDANIGLNCGASGVLVVDLDGPDAIAAWADLAAEHGGHPPTAQVPTGREGGGRHVYFAAVEPPRSRALGPGIDTRGSGGYVILPPSVHVSGRRYGWPVCRRIEPAPGWLLDLLAPPPPAPVGELRELPAGVDGATRYGRAALDGLAAEMAATPEGARHRTLVGIAKRVGRLELAGEVDGALAESLIVEAAVSAGLPRREAEGAYRDGRGYGLAAGPSRRKAR